MYDSFVLLQCENVGITWKLVDILTAQTDKEQIEQILYQGFFVYMKQITTVDHRLFLWTSEFLYAINYFGDRTVLLVKFYLLFAVYRDNAEKIRDLIPME